MGRPPAVGDFVSATYWDHLEFRFSDPYVMAPQRRKRYGRLTYESPEYVIIVSDEKDEPPTLKGGDAKASGIVLLKTDLVELRKLP